MTRASKRVKTVAKKRQRKLCSPSEFDYSPGSSPAVQCRSSARLAKKLDDAAMKTPKAQGQGTGPTSSTLHPSRFKDVVGDNIINVSPMPMISSPLSSRPALARCDHQALAERDEASITTPSERPPASELKLGQTQSLNLTEMAAMCVADDFNKEEVESDPSLVSVQGYKVKENLAKLLETIFVKYGDIAAQCSLSRMEWRSRFLEDVCRVFQSLEETDFARITPQEIKEKIEILEDIEKLNIQVGWLRKRLSDILEARQLLKQYLTLKESKDRNAEVIDTSEKELEEFELERVTLETNMSLLKKKIDATKFKLVAAKSTTKEIKGTHSIAKTKVGQFYKQSLVDGLL